MYVIIDSHGLIASKLSYMAYADWVPSWAYIANRNINSCTLLLCSMICRSALFSYSTTPTPLYCTTLFLSTTPLFSRILSTLLLFSSLLYYSYSSLIYYSFSLYSTTLFLCTLLLFFSLLYYYYSILYYSSLYVC